MSLKSSTLLYASLGTVVTGCMAYAAYFDYRRRNDPEFRKALKREAKRQARAAKEEAKENSNRERQEIRGMVDAALDEGWPKTAEEQEAYFMEAVAKGEQYGASASTYKDSALCFFNALHVYPNPKELMSIYDKTVAKPVLDILAEMIAYERVMGDAGASTDGGASSAAGGVE